MRITFTPHVQHLLIQQFFASAQVLNGSTAFTTSDLEDLEEGDYVCDLTRKFTDGSEGYVVISIQHEKFVVDFSLSMPDCNVTYTVNTQSMNGNVKLFQNAIKAIIPLWDSVHRNYTYIGDMQKQ